MDQFDPSKMIAMMIDEVAAAGDTPLTGERCLSLAEMLLAFEQREVALAHADRAVQIYEDVHGVDAEPTVEARLWRQKAFSQDGDEPENDQQK